MEVRLLGEHSVQVPLHVVNVDRFRSRDATPVLLDGAVHGHRVGGDVVAGAFRNADASRDEPLGERLPELTSLCGAASFLPPF
eukprot:7676203-Pyramimonas_sp.AAC.1